MVYNRKEKILLDQINIATILEFLLPGLFTLLGAYIGANLAGKHAVNSVKKQLEYDKINKRIDTLDDYLKISDNFSVVLNVLSELIQELHERKFFDEEKSSKENDITTEILNTLIHDIKLHIDELSRLPIESIPYDYYRSCYIALNHLKAMESLCHLISSERRIIATLDNSSEKNVELIESYTNKFIIYKDRINQDEKSITKQYMELLKEYRELENKSINIVL